MVRFYFFAIFWLGCSWGAAHAKTASMSEAPPTDLRIELLKGPWVKNIRDGRPEFSWVVKSTSKNAKQLAFQIQVGKAGSGFQDGQNLLWDSGRVVSSQSSSVTYEGEPFERNQDYHWRVRSWIKRGTKLGSSLSHWSQPQRFTTARSFGGFASSHDTVATPVSAIQMRALDSGNRLIDFGKAAFGYLELTLNAPHAGTVLVHFGERGSSDGVLRTLPIKSSVRYYVVPLNVHEGLGVYRVHPPRDHRNTLPDKAIAIPGRFGRIAPFRYVELESKNMDVSLEDANQIVVHYPFDPYASYFESSNPLLDDIWELCKYSMKATSFAGAYVDGDRERIPYEADAYINQLSHYLVDSEYALARYTHEYLMVHPTWPTEWKQHSVMMAWADWMYTGDIDSLSSHYERLRQSKTLEPLVRTDGLLVSFPDQSTRAPQMRDLVDWPPSERDNFDFKPVNAVVNAFHYLNLNQMSEMALALGQPDVSKEYAAKAASVYQAYNRVFFDEQTGLYVDGEGSQHSSFHANVAPLAFGLVPEQHHKSVVSFIKQKGMAGSVYFAQYLMEALYLAGEPEYAMALMTSQGKRSWYNMIRVGSTITLEAWDDEFKPNQDWNHAWGAVPGNIVGRYVLGVKPKAPGFSQIEIHPQLGGLTKASGKVPTMKGPVEVSVNLETEGHILMSVSLPANTLTDVVLPVPEGVKILKVRLNKKTVTPASSDLGPVLRGIGSGSYQIAVTVKKPS